MKDGFVPIPELTQKSNETVRKAFVMPETNYITTKEPTIDNMKLGELRTYYDGTDYWLYKRVAKDKMARVKWTIV